MFFFSTEKINKTSISMEFENGLIISFFTSKKYQKGHPPLC